MLAVSASRREPLGGRICQRSRPGDAGAVPQKRVEAVMSPLRVTLTLVVINAAVAGCADIAPTENPELTLHGPNVVRYPAKAPILEKYHVRGFINSQGTCSLQRHFENRPGQRTVVYESVIEADRTACEFIVARHPEESLPADMRRQIEELEKKQERARQMRQVQLRTLEPIS